jgi:phosphate transport system substrate-binding protein
VRTENSIGYVELAYSIAAGLNFANVENQAGNFIKPTVDSVRAAAAARASEIPQAGNESWSNVTLIDSPGAESYPIASFTYLLLYEDLSTDLNMDHGSLKEN